MTTTDSANSSYVTFFDIFSTFLQCIEEMLPQFFPKETLSVRWVGM